MKHLFRYVSLTAAFCALLAAAPAAAQELSKDQIAGLAAARSDAFINLRSQVYALPSQVRRSLGGLAARDAKARGGIEAALLAARVVDGPNIADDGLVHVGVEIDLSTLPYDVRSKAPNLPKRVQADGAADIKKAFLAAGANVGGVADEVKQWAEGPLEAEGEAKVPNMSNAERATAAARALATTSAYAALAKKVFALPLDADNVTIAAFVKQHPGLRADVNAAMAGAVLASESLDRGGRVYKVKISLPGRALLPPLKLGPFRSSPETVLTPAAVKLARINAYADAMVKLKRRVYNLPLRTGAKVETLFARDAAMKRRVDRLFRRRSSSRFEVTRDGVAKVYVTMITRELPASVRDLLAAGTATRLYAVGAGLPVRKVPPAPAKKPASDVKPDAEPKVGAPPAAKEGA